LFRRFKAVQANPEVATTIYKEIVFHVLPFELNSPASIGMPPNSRHRALKAVPVDFASQIERFLRICTDNLTYYAVSQ